MNEQSKNLTIQELRGLCIIAVIFIHLPSGTIESNSYDYWMFLRRIINFPVAIFIFLAGYFSNFNRDKYTISQFYKKRFIRILIPFLLWSVAYTCISMISKHNPPSFYTILSILRGNSVAHLYFILVLLQLILLPPFLTKVIVSKNKIGFYLLLLITPLYLFFLYCYNISTNSIFPAYHEYCFAWIIFYILGIAYRNKIITFKLSFTSKIGLTLIAIIFSLAEMKFLDSLGLPVSFSISQVTFSSFFYSITLLLVFFSVISQNISNKFLVSIGDFSFGIYFIHIGLIVILQTIITKILPPLTNFPSYFIFQILLGFSTLITSYYIVKTASKFLSQKWSKYLGFR